MVQSIKTLRDHQLKPIGTSHAASTDLEESAIYGNVDGIREGLFVDTVVFSDVDQLTKLIEEEVSNGKSMRDSIIKAIRQTSQVKQAGGLAKGKIKRTSNDISEGNIMTSKRKRNKVVKFSRLLNADERIMKSKVTTERIHNAKPKASILKKGNRLAKVGDLISVSPEIFDGETPGSYSQQYPERVYGTVKAIAKNGLASVIWVEDGSADDCKLKDLKVEKEKFTTETIIARIVALLVEGDKVSITPVDEATMPKNFFEVLVRSDWRLWVEAVKKELDAWDDNNAVTITPISEVPLNAKIVPLGELYSIKRDKTYKFRQYIMGNLLRPGIDFDNNFSTTISSTGTTVFFSLGATSNKPIGGWDAIAGYLQTTEQFGIYAYLPSHAEYSSLDYSEIAQMRSSFLKIFKTDGMKGIRQWAANHKKQYRSNPDKVYKCN